MSNLQRLAGTNWIIASVFFALGAINVALNPDFPGRALASTSPEGCASDCSEVICSDGDAAVCVFDCNNIPSCFCGPCVQCE